MGRRLWMDECVAVDELLDGRLGIDGWKQDYG
jgi:hypothetical protein